MEYDNKRSRVLAEAMDLINKTRQSEYGPPAENFKRIADGWSVIFGGQTVTAEQVALAMAWLKIARICGDGKASDDSYVDAAAYMALAAELSEC